MFFFSRDLQVSVHPFKCPGSGLSVVELHSYVFRKTINDAFDLISLKMLIVVIFSPPQDLGGEQPVESERNRKRWYSLEHSRISATTFFRTHRCSRADMSDDKPAETVETAPAEVNTIPNGKGHEPGEEITSPPVNDVEKWVHQLGILLKINIYVFLQEGIANIDLLYNAHIVC